MKSWLLPQGNTSKNLQEADFKGLKYFCCTAAKNLEMLQRSMYIISHTQQSTLPAALRHEHEYATLKDLKNGR
jgi:hypothetical protein